MIIKKTSSIGMTTVVGISGKTWLNARDLYRDLAIPPAPIGIDFTAWFERWVEGEYQEGKDYEFEQDGQIKVKSNEKTRWSNNPITFKITQRVYDEISQAERGPPVERMRHFTRTVEFKNMSDKERDKWNWNQPLSQQTHAITEEDEE